MNSKHVWVVTFHFSRGNAQTNWFSTKKDAQDAINVTVFNNEDCINCSVHRQDVSETPSDKDIDDAFTLQERKMLKAKMQVLDKM